MSAMRVGLGIDLHRRDPARPLSLAGVLFDGEPGLAGHSDGDVACHAVADALLGACAMGDIGEHFPDSDPSFEGISGLDLLGAVVRLLAAQDLSPTSCDLTLIAESPRLAPRRAEMRRNLAATLGVSLDSVSVKATRPEGLGLSGDGAGAMAVATVEPSKA